MTHLVGRLFSSPAPLVYRKCAVFIVLLFAVTCWAPRAAAQVANVSVTINSVNNRACIDQFIFCGKADMMVRVALRESSGIQRKCADTVPIANFDNIGPMASCAGVLVTTPVTLVVTVFDVDERKLPSTVEIQSEIRLSASGSGATLPWSLLNGMPQVINDPQAQARIILTATVTPVPPAFGTATLNVSRSQIDPAIPNDTARASNTIVIAGTRTIYPSSVGVVYSVQYPGGGVRFLADAVEPATGFTHDWDGRIDRQAVPAGVYQLRATLSATGQTISAPVTVTSISNVFEIRGASPDPWNARAGPLSFAYRLSPGGTISWQIEGSSLANRTCTLEQPIVVPANKVGPLKAGNGTFSVPVTTPEGCFLSPGKYRVRFQANTETGNPIGTKAIELNVNVIEPKPLRIVASLSPAVPWIFPTTTARDAMGNQVPVPAGPVFVEVRAFDDKSNPRPTGQITVRALPFLIIPVPGNVVTTLTCRGVSVCRMPIGMQTLTRAKDVIFDADASDLTSADSADPPPLTASAPQRAAALVWTQQDRAGPVSVPVTGSAATGFDTVPHNRSQDVAFHVGTGLKLSSGAQATQVSNGIANILNVFFGGDPRVGANSITEDRGQSVAFWLTRKPAVVDTEAANPDRPGWPTCRRSQLESVPFADVQAVIHAVDCRDNADWNNATFSAGFENELGLVAWHEFHHAAYDLADEYPGGTHYLTDPFPNVMRNHSECLQKGAQPNLCAQIGTSGWWRAAPTPDVMNDHTRENIDDMNRARWVQILCRTGRC